MLVVLGLTACGPAAEREAPPPDTAREEAPDEARAPDDALVTDTVDGREGSRPDTGGAAAARPGVRPAPGACVDTLADHREEDGMADTTGSDASIHEVLERHRDAWMERDDVVGTGIGRCDGAPCLVIYLRELTGAVEAELPDCVEGHPVRLEETGTVRPRDGEGPGDG